MSGESLFVVILAQPAVLLPTGGLSGRNEWMVIL
jgi:hypothetical protein